MATATRPRVGHPSRPLSPHLTIWKWRVHTIVSITHRITGNAMAFGAVVLFLWWLIAAATGPEAAYATFYGVATGWVGVVVGIGLTWTLFQHMASGVRHLVMDTGSALRNDHASKTFGDADLCLRRCSATLAVWARRLRDQHRPALLTMGTGTELGRVRGLGAAKSGVGHWWHQRVTGGRQPRPAALVRRLASSACRRSITSDGRAVAAATRRCDPDAPSHRLGLLPFPLSACRCSSRTICTTKGTKLLALLALNFYALGGAAAAVFAVLKIALSA